MRTPAHPLGRPFSLLHAALAFLSLAIPSVRSATVIGGTGYSVDAIVEASAASPTAGTDYDGWANWVLVEMGAPNQVDGVGLPADGQLTSKNGTPFQLQPYTAPNTLVNGDTFTLDTPRAASATCGFLSRGSAGHGQQLHRDGHLHLHRHLDGPLPVLGHRLAG